MVGPVTALEGKTPEDKHVKFPPPVPSSDCGALISSSAGWEGLVNMESFCNVTLVYSPFFNGKLTLVLVYARFVLRRRLCTAGSPARGT